MDEIQSGKICVRANSPKKIISSFPSNPANPQIPGIMIQTLVICQMKGYPLK